MARPLSVAAVDALAEKLRACAHPGDVDPILQKLKRSGPEHRGRVADALAEYMRAGRIEHWRSFVTSDLANLVAEGDARHADAFRAALRDPVTAYWAVRGLARTLGKTSYEELCAFAFDETRALDARAHAIRTLADLSRQTFIRGLPTDPGDWTLEALPLESLARWRAEGFPDGPGFAAPVVSPALHDPQTPVDVVAARLEAKLRRARAERHDPANPSNWLVPASPEALVAVQERWPLPERYVEFLAKFSPLAVTVYGRGCGQGVWLMGADELVSGQDGYSFDPVANAPIDDWNPEHVVIAAEAGDPYVLDLGAARGGDCPVLHALHGQGSWRFAQVTARFTSFVARLAR